MWRASQAASPTVFSGRGQAGCLDVCLDDGRPVGPVFRVSEHRRFGPSGSVAKTDEVLQYEYGRSALRLGLSLEDRVGVNPYMFGLIGSTDTHTSLATTREENYFGKFTATESSPEHYEHYVIRSDVDESLSTLSSEEVASGLAAVWARENTREALFDAMRRKEVYATTGTRIMVRVFGGWNFEADEVERPDFADQGYARGVPMGGELTRPRADASPSFMIRALRHADGANLDRVQVIKGWLDGAGETHERIYDVAVSDGRTVGVDGRARTPVGTTVDIADASYATRRDLAALSRSYVACRFIHSLAEVPSVSARSSAASAVTPRLPRISSLSRARVQPIRCANSAWVIPIGSRNSSRRSSPGWKGFVGCVCTAVPPSVIVDDLDVMNLTSTPSEDDAPLVVDPNRVKAAPITSERLQPVAGRHPQVPELGRVVEIE